MDELEAARRYDELFAAVPLPYVVTDASGAIREANPAADRLLGVESRFLAGKPLASFVPGERRPAFRRALIELARGPVRHELRLVLRSRDGAVHEVDATVERVGGLPGALRWLLLAADARAPEVAVRVAAGVRERTAELTATTLGLERDRELLDSILRQIPSGILVAEAPTGRPLIVNEQLVRLLGADAVDAAALPGSPIARALGGEHVADDLRLPAPHGAERRVAVRAAPVRDPHGAVIAAVASFDDLSALDRREAAEREFVANAAHALQTPLAAIASAIEVLQSGAKETPATRDRFLAHIERNAQRLVRLSRALLTLARVQALGERPAVNVVALEPLLTSLAREAARGRQAEIALSCPPDVAVVANRELLEEALANLVENAARHGGGHVAIGVTAADGRARVEVVNAGELDAAEGEGAFGRFVTSGRGGGSGLGLAVVREAAQALGAEVAVAPDPERGVVATLTLLAAREIA